MAPPYTKILSLDGGGSWALIEAYALGELYGPDTKGREILERFDLVFANSGGSIVVGALVANQTPRQIVGDFFLDEDKRRSIFKTTGTAFLTSWVGLGPRYRTASKLEGLRQIFGNIEPGLPDMPFDKLGGLGRRLPDLVFTSFDYDRLRATYLRSYLNSGASSNPGVSSHNSPTFAEAIHASTNAPVNYFDQPALFGGDAAGDRRYWDGGISGLNNPCLAAVTEALANGSDPGALKVISLGTATVLLPLASGAVEPPLAVRRCNAGLLGDIRKLAKAVVDDPPDAASYISYRILHGGGKPAGAPRFVRLSPLIQPKRVGTDGWDYPDAFRGGFPEADDEMTAFERLVELDMDAIAPNDVDLIWQLAKEWTSGNMANQPVQVADDVRSAIVGHDSFLDAKAAALAIVG